MATSMVTGGTSGIGREFVTQLAARGDDIVIVARDTERMAAIKADVEARYGVSVETIAADLSRREDVDQITTCLLYTSPSPRDKRQSRMPSSA